MIHPKWELEYINLNKGKEKMVNSNSFNQFYPSLCHLIINCPRTIKYSCRWCQNNKMNLSILSIQMRWNSFSKPIWHINHSAASNNSSLAHSLTSKSKIDSKNPWQIDIPMRIEWPPWIKNIYPIYFRVQTKLDIIWIRTLLQLILPTNKLL